MTKNYIKPQYLDDLIKNLTEPNTTELDAFTTQFPQEVIEFSEVFSKAYKVYLELTYQVVKRHKEGEEKIIQSDFIQFFTYQFLDNLFSSMKLFFYGFQVSSGNLLRQVAEGIAVTILCSINFEINRIVDYKKKKLKKFNYFESFKKDEPFARSFKAMALLDLNKEILGLSNIGYDFLELLKQFNNQYSHPTMISTLSFIAVDPPEKFFFGGGFDEGKLDIYTTELKIRIELCKTIPELLNGLIINEKKLT